MVKLCFAGILSKDLTEVLVYVERGTSTDKNALRKDRAVLLVLVEVVRASRNVVTELPDAMTTNRASAIEGVESGGCARWSSTRTKAVVGSWDQRTASTANHVAGCRGTLTLDGW